MKKILRLTALVLTLLMLIFTFCGCDAIDEARKNHGFWQDADKTVIELGGKEYKLLPECQYLNPSIDNSYDYVSVTDKDVPLLCKEIFGENFLRSDDGLFLVGDFYGDIDGAKTLNYCVSDRYDEIVGRINGKIEMNRFCYTYYNHDDDYNYINVTLKQFQSESVLVRIKRNNQIKIVHINRDCSDINHVSLLANREIARHLQDTN